MTRRTAPVIAAATAGASAAARHSANSDGPEPEMLQPSAPASTAARLIAGQPRNRAARGAARRSCPRASARSARSLPGAGRPRARRGSPTAGSRRPAAPCRRAAPGLARSRFRDRGERRRPSGRQERAAGRCPADSARRTSTRPPQIDGAMLSACAEPAPRRSPSSAHAISVSTGDRAPRSASTATTAAAALAALPPRPLASGSPLRIVERHAAPLAERGQQRPRGDARPCCARPRAAAAPRRR